MTGQEAYGFCMLLSWALLAVVVPYMAWQQARNRDDGVRACVAAIQAAGVTSLLATLLVWLFPGSPLRERAGEVAETRDIMIMLGAVLAVVLSAVGTGSIFLCLRNGLLSRDHVLGTAAVIVATWALVTFGFAWLALG